MPQQVLLVWETWPEKNEFYLFELSDPICDLARLCRDNLLGVCEEGPEEDALLRLSGALVNYQAIELSEDMPKGLNIVEVIRAGVIL